MDNFEELVCWFLSRSGIKGAPDGLERLSGGASMECWQIDVGLESYILRRAPSVEFMAGRLNSHAAEAAVIRAARAHGVSAPEVVQELAPVDRLGSGYLMRAVRGTADPATILNEADGDRLIKDVARELAAIHTVDCSNLSLQLSDGSDQVGKLAARFNELGGDRPILALALEWLKRNIPPAAESRLVHGDFRLGNLMVANSGLAGVLDWELAHLGDPHEDLAFGCLNVWRFSRRDRPAFGLADMEALVRTYEASGGVVFDPARFRFWTVCKTVWWALSCLQMAHMWRSGADRQIERVVVGRRTSEQELDLLRLLEGDAPEAERAIKLVPAPVAIEPIEGEPTAIEILTAVSEWLAYAVKIKLAGRERFEFAVAQNALGIVRRQLAGRPDTSDKSLADDILAGRVTLATPGLLADLRRRALDTVSADMPKYPALAEARGLWE